MNSTVIIVIAIVIVALVIIGVAVLVSSRRNARRREVAGHLRTQAIEQSVAVESSQQDAAAAQARAELARAEAERAEQQAAEAQRGLQVDEAQQEDALRSADAIDPDVDHRADDYHPESPASREP